MFRLITLLVVGAGLVVAGCSSPAVRGSGTEGRGPRAARWATDTVVLAPDEDKISGAAYFHYTTGVLYDNMGNPYQAAESYRRALEIYPDSREIRRALAESLVRMQRFDDALMVLRGVSDLSLIHI